MLFGQIMEQNTSSAKTLDIFLEGFFLEIIELPHTLFLTLTHTLTLILTLTLTPTLANPYPKLNPSYASKI